MQQVRGEAVSLDRWLRGRKHHTEEIYYDTGIFPVGVVLRNPAVEYNMTAFSELSFAVRWQGK